MATGTRLIEDPDQVATQIFEDIHRGLALALETKQAMAGRSASRFPYSQHTLDTLIFLATKEYSLPISYTWGIEGPYFQELSRDRIGAKTRDFRQVAQETDAHYPLLYPKWGDEVSKESRIQKQEPTRSKYTPPLDALERFFIQEVEKIEGYRLEAQTPEAQDRAERVYRIQSLTGYFPAGAGQLYQSGLQLLNILDLAEEEIDHYETSSPTKYGTLSPQTGGEISDRYADFKSHINQVLYQSLQSRFLRMAFGKEEEAGDREELVKGLSAFFESSPSAYRYIVEADDTQETKSDFYQELSRFYRQRAWSLITHSIGSIEAQGPTSSVLRETAREKWKESYFAFSSDLVDVLLEMRNRLEE